MKAVLFATGPLEHAVAAARDLASRFESLIIVAEPSAASSLQAVAPNATLLPMSPGIVLQVRTMLGSVPAEVYCLSVGHGHRLMKLLAYAVRQNVTFLREDTEFPLSLAAFVWFTLSRLWMRGNGALLVGCASPATLDRLTADLRGRRPDAVVEVLPGGLLAAPAAYLKTIVHWRRYRYLSIPWTGEGHNVLKLAAWLLPCGRREIYNEAGDSFSVRLAGTLAAHVGRRAKERSLAIWNGLRYVAWKTGDGLRTAWNGCRHVIWRTGDVFAAAWNGIRYAAWWIGDRCLSAWYATIANPPGVTVIGSASGYYMKDIVANLRQRFPGEPIYGLLPERLVRPTGKLFDHVIPMRAGTMLRHAFGGSRTGYLAIPCTNEGYNRYKLFGSLLPMGRRIVYNECADGYDVRRISVVVEHVFWRLRHRLFYQAFTQSKGRPWIVVYMHLFLYPFRLMAGAFVLAGIRMRAKSRYGADLYTTQPLLEPESEEIQEVSRPVRLSE